MRCSYFQVLNSYNEKLLREPNYNRTINCSGVVPLSLKYNLLWPSIHYEGDTIHFATGVKILNDATGGQEEQDSLFYVNYHTACS